VLEHALNYNLPNDEGNYKSKILKDWINTRTDEEFTALHFLSYHGKIEKIMDLVDKYGADFKFRNIYGANVLHIAAQGDQPAPLFYFTKTKGMMIDDADNRGSTALHWACFARSEFALSYILSMQPNLEYQDNQGNTPLHLAIKSVATLRSTRPVRALLLRGAKRSAKNKRD